MAEVFQDKGRWGVQADNGALIYEAVFREATAKRIAELESKSMPPKDWEETESILKREGYITK